jgi:hypothetical protein
MVPGRGLSTVSRSRYWPPWGRVNSEPRVHHAHSSRLWGRWRQNAWGASAAPVAIEGFLGSDGKKNRSKMGPLRKEAFRRGLKIKPEPRWGSGQIEKGLLSVGSYY